MRGGADQEKRSFTYFGLRYMVEELTMCVRSSSSWFVSDNGKEEAVISTVQGVVAGRGFERV